MASMPASTTKKKASVLVLGATGRCGQAVVKRALDLGMNVRVYVRNQAKARDLFARDTNNDTATSCCRVEILQGELEDVDKLASAVQGVDGVVCVLASYFSPNTQMSTAMQGIAKAAHSQASHERQTKLRVFHCGVCGLQNPESDFLLRQALGSLLGPFSSWKFGECIKDHR